MLHSTKKKIRPRLLGGSYDIQCMLVDTMFYLYTIVDVSYIHRHDSTLGHTTLGFKLKKD